MEVGALVKAHVTKEEEAEDGGNDKGKSPGKNGGKDGAKEAKLVLRDSEPVTVTFVVTDVLKVTLSVSHRNDRKS